MCLAIPAKVLRVEGNTALVRIEDTEYNASLLLLEDVCVGDYVMLHAGFAIQKIDEEEAMATLRLIREVASYNTE